MIKDRTGSLKAAASGSFDFSDVSISLRSDGSDSFIADFFNEVDEVSQSLDKIEASVDQVKKIHSHILSEPVTEEKVKQELEDLMADIKKLTVKVRTRLNVMKEAIEEEKKRNCTSAQYRIRTTQHSTLLIRFLEAMSEYNRIQVEYRQRCKDRIQRQLQITGRLTSDDEIEKMLEMGNPAIFSQGIITETQKARQTLADIEDRHADIMKLEKSIKSLHDMFVDMASLIEDQGELINNIEQNVKNSADYVAKAKVKIIKARTYHDKSRKKLIIIIIVLAVLLGVIALIIWLATKK